MENWIGKRIRIAARRRFGAWTVVLVIGLLAATSNQRYIANFLRGPYPLARADLDSISDVSLTPRYYARVAGEKVLDTGLRQYRVHTTGGVETSREESGAYRALVFGNRFLVVRTAGGESQIVEGRLAPWPEGLENRLFDSKEMLSLRSNFYPFYLDGDSFRRPGYVVIIVALLFIALFAWQAIPAWCALRAPESHPLHQRVAAWGDPMGVAVEAEHDFDHPMLKGGGGWRLGNKYLVQSRFFSFNVLRVQDVLWGYKKITKHSVNFIPTGKTYEAIVACHGGTATIPAKEKQVHDLLTYVQQRAPWAIFGFSDQLASLFRKQPLEFANSVAQRRQQWEQQGGKA
ncbi:MAG: DUF6709 family protein [Gemmatimonadales bacterium]